MKMIGWAVMKSKSNASDQNIVSPELCGGCNFFYGFGCDRSPIMLNADQELKVCPCDIINNHDRTNVYGYNCNGHSQQRADSRKDLVNDS